MAPTLYVQFRRIAFLSLSSNQSGFLSFAGLFYS